MCVNGFFWAWLLGEDNRLGSRAARLIDPATLGTNTLGEGGLFTQIHLSYSLGNIIHKERTNQ